jgi:hypothetical protein
MLPVHAQSDQILPPIGGPGGGQYVARCPPGELLAGFDLRTGDDVDALRPLCAVASAPAHAGVLHPSSSQYGGSGGGPRRLACPGDAPIVTGMSIGYEGVATIIVNNIHLFCGVAATTQSPSQYPAAVFDGPVAHGSGAFGRSVKTGQGTQYCPAGLVAVGVSGRSGLALDAAGLICGAPPAMPEAQAPPATKPPISLGRSKSVAKPITMVREAGSGTSIAAAAAAQQAQPGDPPICTSARSARAHNSPAAPGLEKQCAAARAKNPPAQSPPPPSPLPPPPPASAGHAFVSPAFKNGARLWACFDAKQGKKGAACTGVDSGKAYCHGQGHSGALQMDADGDPDLKLRVAPSGTHVRAVNGDACKADKCMAIIELHCAD